MSLRDAWRGFVGVPSDIEMADMRVDDATRVLRRIWPDYGAYASVTSHCSKDGYELTRGQYWCVRVEMPGRIAEGRGRIFEWAVDDLIDKLGASS